MNNLKTEIKYVKNVGPSRAKLLKKLGVQTVEDLFFLFPRDYIHLNNISGNSLPKPNQRVSFTASIKNITIKNSFGNKKQVNAIASTKSFNIKLSWFNAGKWLINELKNDNPIWISGIVTKFMNELQIVHPQIENLAQQKSSFWRKRKVLPVYPLTAGIKIYAMRNIIFSAFEQFHNSIIETLPDYIIKKYNFEEKHTAIQRIHFPSAMPKTEKALTRFKYEELFYHQLLLKRCYKNHQKQKGINFALLNKYPLNLPFELTNAQKKVVNEIALDMQKPVRMNRLIQGDVGSGKTIVALMAILIAVENGYQAALMAPTEILAEQHFSNISKLLQNYNLNIALIKGGVSKQKKEQVQKIADGEINIAIGTHALIQKTISFKKLGLAVIDEQHRFGVEQRSNLSGFSNSDVLYLSATPIPRSLAMTVYGDLDLSIIDELPPNRKQVETVWKGEQKRAEVYNKVLFELKKDRQAYVVCPLIEESEKIDLLDAKKLFEKLSKQFKGFKCSLLHGKLKQKEKDAIMLEFKQNKTQVLVSTTVIEVGVDVPNASIMVIEHSERFGLAQLHQLRGRVGRGSSQAYCYLIAYPPMSNEGRLRLDTMCKTTDGFKIAELDLKLRGAGDVVGKAQSGLPQFKHASVYDTELLQLAEQDAKAVVDDDFDFEKPENAIVKQVYFEKYKDREGLFRI